MQHRRVHPWLLLAACALLGIAAAARGDDGADPERGLARRLASPVAVERSEAIRAAVQHGGAARTWARIWVRSTDQELRAGGWAVLGEVGDEGDVAAARAALSDPQPSVAGEAARALLGLVEHLPVDPRPWIPSGTLDPGRTRTLAYALASRFEGSPAGTVPPWLPHLGEGVLPCLLQMLRHPRFDTGIRLTAIASLAAVGGPAARAALSELAPWLEAIDADPLWLAWWQALVEVGPGQGLEGAQAFVVRSAEALGWGNGFGRAPGLGWGNQVWFYRFLATCPPAEGLDALRTQIDGQLERAANSSRSRPWPSLAADAVRAHLVLAEPNDERLTWDVLAARPPPRGGLRRRQEELGEVLQLLEPYKMRPGVQTGLAQLLRGQDLPKTVRAWALYLQGDTPPEVLRGLAEGLIDADGAAATVAQRRLGAQLLDRLGAPAPARIPGMLADIDPWMRALGLDWAQRAAQAGRFPASELDAALRKALSDEAPEPFLRAAQLAPGRLQRAMFRRLLELGIGGPRTGRGTAWAIVARALGELRTTDEEPFSAPGGHTGLDERLRAAALALRLWEARGR